MWVIRIGTSSVCLSVCPSVNTIAAKRFEIFKICFHHSIHMVTSIQTSYYGQNRLTGTGSKVRGQTYFFIKPHSVMHQKKALASLSTVLLFSWVKINHSVTYGPTKVKNYFLMKVYSVTCQKKALASLSTVLLFSRISINPSVTFDPIKVKLILNGRYMVRYVKIKLMVNWLHV